MAEALKKTTPEPQVSDEVQVFKTLSPTKVWLAKSAAISGARSSKWLLDLIGQILPAALGEWN